MYFTYPLFSFYHLNLAKNSAQEILILLKATHDHLIIGKTGWFCLQ